MAAIKGGARFTTLIMATLIDDHDLSVPSLYAPVAITREQYATETARGLAESGSDSGVVAWARRDDRVDCAVVLGPEAPSAEFLLVSYVAAVGFGDWARRRPLRLHDDGSVQFAEDGGDGKDVTVPLTNALRNPSCSL